MFSILQCLVFQVLISTFSISVFGSLTLQNTTDFGSLAEASSFWLHSS